MYEHKTVGLVFLNNEKMEQIKLKLLSAATAGNRHTTGISDNCLTLITTFLYHLNFHYQGQKYIFNNTKIEDKYPSPDLTSIA